MRNLVLIFATLLCVYLYRHPRVETRVEPAAKPLVAVAARPAPTTAPVYYHSPLEAGSMSTSASTGTGYFSNDPNSRFRNVYYGGYPAGGYYGTASGGYPGYAGGSSSVTNTTVIYNASSGGTGVCPRPTPLPHAYVGPLPTGSRNTDGAR